MTDGFIKCAAAVPAVRVGDTEYNKDRIITQISLAAEGGAKIAVFPELCVTAYTCGDLFLQDTLTRDALKAVFDIAKSTAGLDILVSVGLPLLIGSKLYNAAAVIKDGVILGFVTKSHLPAYAEYYEVRHFNTMSENTTVRLDGRDYPVGPNLIFCSEEIPELKVGIEICEDLWVTSPPSGGLCRAGATVILNPSAGDEVISKADYRRSLCKSQSARCLCGYVYANAGDGESTTDMVFSGHRIICENGTVLSESPLFESGITFADIDVNKLTLERRRMTTFKEDDSGYEKIYFSLNIGQTKLSRKFDAHPFVPDDAGILRSRCEAIFTMQAMGLKKRLEHISCKAVTIGISGGLDSTLALLVTEKAFSMLNLDLSGIKAITMPCFGTTDRTLGNAKELIGCIGAELVEVPINKSVTQHMSDIGADINSHNITYENAQARERTQVLMDYANEVGGIVIGTGDLSELALGWATYNGDHMSMYGVNCSIPKTLVRYLVKYVADISEGEMREVLYDILDTPVSPELLPPKDGRISQQTEDIVGPYELHDFFLYNFVRSGFTKQKVFRLAKEAFSGVFSEDVISKWLDIFCRRFFNNQFKRSCIPDGPKVGSVTLSPRGDWRMPSDAVMFWR